MGVQPCGHADADGHAGMWMGVQKWMTVKKEKKKKRKEKEKTHWCSERADGRVDVLWMGGREWL